MLLLLELLELERRHAEHRVYAALAAEHRDGRIRRRHRYRQRIELAVVFVAIGRGRRHLQQHRLHRNLDRRHCDAVAVGEVLDGLDIRIGGVEQNGCELSAQIPLTSNDVPCVLSHSVISPGTPPLTMSVELDSSASFIATGPLKRCQETLKSFRPRLRRRTSRSALSRFMTLNCR